MVTILSSGRWVKMADVISWESIASPDLTMHRSVVQDKMKWDETPECDKITQDDTNFDLTYATYKDGQTDSICEIYQNVFLEL